MSAALQVRQKTESSQIGWKLLCEFMLLCIMYLQITGEVSKKFLSAQQPFKQKKKKRESSQKRLKVFMCLYSLVNALCIYK